MLHQYEQARQNLSSAITDLQVVRQNDQTAFPKLYLVRARRFLGMALVGLKNADGAIAEIELAASMAADLAVTESKNYVLLNSLASEHLGLAELYATLKCPELAASHREIQTKLLSNIIDGFPSNPFYRCQAAQAFVNQAYPCILRKEFDVARQCLTNAEMVLQRSATEHATDLVVRKTLGNLRSGIGRWHFHQGQFELALTEFTAAGLLFPSADNLAAKAVALAHVNPEEALAVIELITNIETPSRRPLKNLLDACGHASKKTTDERLVARLGDQAVRLLQHMKNENYVSQFSTIDQLNRSPTFSKLREREDFVDLVAELTERHKLLHAPADQPSLGPDRN